MPLRSRLTSTHILSGFGRMSLFVHCRCSLVAFGCGPVPDEGRLRILVRAAPPGYGPDGARLRRDRRGPDISPTAKRQPAILL